MASIRIEEGKHYTISKWRGVNSKGEDQDYPNYECTKDCQYSTLYLEKMQDHWDKSHLHNHAWAKPKPQTEGGEATTPEPVY